MHFFYFRKTNGFSRQPLNSCSQGQVFAFYLLSILLSYHQFFRGEMTFVGPPIIRIKSRHAEGLQPFFELLKNDIFSVAKDVGEDGSGGMINGMPQPALLFLLANIAPHLIQFSVFNLMNMNGNFTRLETFQYPVVDRFKTGFFFLISLITVLGLIFNTRAVSRMPLPFIAMSIICFFTSGK